MAEVGLVASLLGISTFGIQLTRTLYNFGSTASSAREQTDYIARHVTLYSDVLDLLAQRIDDDEPIHSRKAIDLVYDIYDQSCDLFNNIRDLLPDRADKISFMQKIKWNFKKTKVDLLVSEIEYLKSTVNLLSKKAEKEAKAQFARAQNAIVEQVNATAIKENLQAKIEEDDQNPVEKTADTNGDWKSVAVIKHAPHIA
ncbi:uncharacterized protein A1O5_02230 [Cladophialophora psammophila CBS 110553]|uniref:Fungal N-terminal domain-containing protein n=1 Tax=Cladophialophora psammophila CBS 110553 TaxID=1182543 RepID=W9XAK3_9EURO|nr:uncharacterized protein A1O5_02230 [Cladophialophora psammophila CBS 110553]EXJ73936.1 hypothetical protein A1O5_02230 [Cladophialophora psammophila CBS 110553]